MCMFLEFKVFSFNWKNLFIFVSLNDLNIIKKKKETIKDIKKNLQRSLVQVY